MAIKKTKDKKVKIAKDATFEILQNAKNEAFQLQQLQLQEAANDLDRQTKQPNDDIDARINLELVLYRQRALIVKSAADYEIGVVNDKLAHELATEKHNATEIEALRLESANKISLITEKYKDDTLKVSNDITDAITKINEDEEKKLQKQYDLDEKAFEQNLERKAKLLEDDNKRKQKKIEDDNKVRADAEKVLQKELGDAAKEGIDTVKTFVDAGFENKKNEVQKQIDLSDKQKEAEIKNITDSSFSATEKAAQITIAEKKCSIRKRTASKTAKRFGR